MEILNSDQRSVKNIQQKSKFVVGL